MRGAWLDVHGSSGCALHAGAAGTDAVSARPGARRLSSLLILTLDHGTEIMTLCATESAVARINPHRQSSFRRRHSSSVMGRARGITPAGMRCAAALRAGIIMRDERTPYICVFWIVGSLARKINLFCSPRRFALANCNLCKSDPSALCHTAGWIL